jgi:hypothetical protein
VSIAEQEGARKPKPHYSNSRITVSVRLESQSA